MGKPRAEQRVRTTNGAFVVRLVLLGLAALIAAGCAGYKLIPITPREAKAIHEGRGDHTEGYVFHAPQPFLLGTLVESGEASRTYDFRVIYLPDYKRPFRFTQYEFLAKSDLAITFAEGWQFTDAKSSTDSTATFSALVDLARGAIGILATERSPPPMILFRIDTSQEPILQPVELPEVLGTTRP